MDKLPKYFTSTKDTYYAALRVNFYIKDCDIARLSNTLRYLYLTFLNK